MINKRTTLFSFIAAAVLSAQALTVTTPGSLSTIIGNEADASTLSIDGDINAADMQYLSTLKSLRSLDMSGARIVGYDGQKLETGIVHSDAGCFPDFALVGSAITDIKLPRELKEIGVGAFAGSNLTQLEIPATVTTIGASAFSGCKNLKTVTVPSTVTTIGDGVFRDCVSMTSASMMTSVIPASAFRGCTSLKSVTVSPSASSIGSFAFAGCSALEKFSFPSTLTAIDDDAFNGTSLEVADMSACRGLKSIGSRAFADCLMLTDVTLPDTDLSLGEGLFFDDAALVNVNLPASITVIPDYIFKGNRNLNPAVVNFNNKVKTIGEHSMTDMPQITEWVAPEALDSIGTGAMEGWTGLTKIDGAGLKTVPALGQDVWAGIVQSEIILSAPDDLVSAFMSTPQWKEFLIKQSGVSTGIDDNLAGNAASVSITVVGSELLIASATDIETVKLFDINGRVITTLTDISAPSATVDLTGLAAGVIIVSVTDTDNITTVAKIVYRG